MGLDEKNIFMPFPSNTPVLHHSMWLVYSG